MPTDSLAALDARGRIAALVDLGSFVEFAEDASSPHLARCNIAAQREDGVVTGTATLAGRPLVVAAQDARFLGGSVGAGHGRKLAALFEYALKTRMAVLLLLDSGGVRLHEANAAELALARALRALLALRIAGMPAISVVAGVCFGGASVLACACSATFMLDAALLGLSGPKVIEAGQGKAELDAADTAAIASIYGTGARTAPAIALPLADEPDVARARIARAIDVATPLVLRVVLRSHRDLRARFAASTGGATISPASTPDWLASAAAAADGWLLRPGETKLFVLAPVGKIPVGPEVMLALTGAVLEFIDRNPVPATLFVIEDSRGHELSRRAEVACLSMYFAQHAAALALAKAQGHRVLGLLLGTGHSAAFFVNALQADTVYAIGAARVIAMEPSAIARVTGLVEAQLATLIEDDPLLGQPVRHLAALGGIAEIWDDASVESLIDAARRAPGG